MIEVFKEGVKKRKIEIKPLNRAVFMLTTFLISGKDSAVLYISHRRDHVHTAYRHKAIY